MSKQKVSVKVPLVVLSGWSMPDSMFLPLQLYSEILPVALPGISTSGNAGMLESISEKELSWSTLVNWLDNQLPEGPVALAGWSLGGSLAISYAAQRPERVKELALLGCNPCFVEREDWKTAMPVNLFRQFEAGLREAPQATLKKFMFLCVQGADNARELLRDMRQAITRGTQYSLELLAGMLALLGDDLRQVLSCVQCPVTHLLAEQDGLVPPVLRHQLKQKYPRHHIVMSQGSHVFFREDPERVATMLNEKTCCA